MNLVLLAISIALVIGFFCRLNKLDIRNHRLGVILFNVGMMGSVGSAGIHAWTDTFDLQDVCVFIACACWIAISYRTWEKGPPDYVHKDHGT